MDDLFDDNNSAFTAASTKSGTRNDDDSVVVDIAGTLENLPTVSDVKIVNHIDRSTGLSYQGARMLLEDQQKNSNETMQFTIQQVQSQVREGVESIASQVLQVQAQNFELLQTNLLTRLNQLQANQEWLGAELRKMGTRFDTLESRQTARARR